MGLLVKYGGGGGGLTWVEKKIFSSLTVLTSSIPLVYLTLSMLVLVLITRAIGLSFLFLFSRSTCSRYFCIYPFVFFFFSSCLFLSPFPLLSLPPWLSSTRPSVGESDRACDPILTGRDFSDFFASLSTYKYPLYFQP